MQVKTGGLISHKTFFFINIVFVENCIVMFTFNSSFVREVVDRLHKLRDGYVFNNIYVVK